MKWSAVITTYNSGSVISRAVDSLLSLDPSEAPLDVVVVDNGSADGTPNILRSYGDRLKLKLNECNLGLSRANNIGASMASGDSIFFLNPDVQVLPGAVSCLVDFQHHHPDAAILGPAMVNWRGEVQSTARTWPTPAVIASRRTRFGRTSLGKRISRDHLNRFGSATEPVRPHWLVGAALWLTPGGRLRTGLMSERYFLYFEDVEWCHRAWKNGMEVWYVPSAVIRHECRRESSSGGTTLKHHLRSMLLFMSSHPCTALGMGPERGAE